MMSKVVNLLLNIIIILTFLSLFSNIMISAYDYVDSDSDVDDISDNYGNYAYVSCTVAGYYNYEDPHYRKGSYHAQRGYIQGSVGYVEWDDTLIGFFECIDPKGNKLYYCEDETSENSLGPWSYDASEPLIAKVLGEAYTRVWIHSPDDLPPTPLNVIVCVER